MVAVTQDPNPYVFLTTVPTLGLASLSKSDSSVWLDEQPNPSYYEPSDNTITNNTNLPNMQPCSKICGHPSFQQGITPARQQASQTDNQPNSQPSIPSQRQTSMVVAEPSAGEPTSQDDDEDHLDTQNAEAQHCLEALLQKRAQILETKVKVESDYYDYQRFDEESNWDAQITAKKHALGKVLYPHQKKTLRALLNGRDSLCVFGHQ